MARSDVTYNEMIEAILRRLRTELGLNERTCYETLHPTAVSIPPGGEFFVSVSPGDGEFPEGHQIGGAENQCTEDGTIVVTMFSRMQLDGADYAPSMLRDESKGLMEIKRLVLKALVGWDATTADDESTFLRQLITVLSSTAPMYDEKNGYGFLSLTFRAGFDWDLS